MTNKELEIELKELKDKLEAREQRFADFEAELESSNTLLREHEHTGSETKRLEDLIKRLRYVDAKEFRVVGVAGIDQVVTIVTTSPAKTHVLTFVKGILTTYTLS